MFRKQKRCFKTNTHTKHYKLKYRGNIRKRQIHIITRYRCICWSIRLDHTKYYVAWHVRSYEILWRMHFSVNPHEICFNRSIKEAGISENNSALFQSSIRKKYISWHTKPQDRFRTIYKTMFLHTLSEYYISSSFTSAQLFVP